MAWLLALWLAWGRPQQFTAAELAQRLDGRFNSLTTLQADFTETSTEGLQTTHGSGRLYMKKPGRMRFDYQQPAPHVFLVDGRQVWQYAPGDTGVKPQPLQEVDDLHTPLRFLLGHTDLEKELSGLSYGGLDPQTAGDWVLHGRPPASQAAWSQVWLEVTPTFDLVRVVVETPGGAQTDLRLSHILANQPLPASLFQYSPGAAPQLK